MALDSVVVVVLTVLPFVTLWERDVGPGVAALLPLVLALEFIGIFKAHIHCTACYTCVWQEHQIGMCWECKRNDDNDNKLTTICDCNADADNGSNGDDDELLIMDYCWL